MGTPRSTEVNEGVTFEAHTLGERCRREKHLELEIIQQCSTRESMVYSLSLNQQRAFSVPVVVLVVAVVVRGLAQAQPVVLLASSVR
jgi:hypothetical protein